MFEIQICWGVSDREGERMKRKLLFISMCLPYNKVPHAGGKTFNYYVKAFANEVENEVVLIAKVLPTEKEYVKTLDEKIKFLPVVSPEKFLKKIFSNIKSLNSKVNPWYKYGNTLTKEIYNQISKRLSELKKEGYSPDVIVLEWTEMLLFVDEIKRIFPNAKYVASEHDVSFLRLDRAKDMEKNWLKKLYRTILYQNIKKRELEAINQCDLVVTHNEKDYKLLIENDILEKRLGIIVPFYDDYLSCVRKSNNKDIIFYGAMNREENYLAVLWFIEQVLPLLEDCDIRFIVIGNRPPQFLQNRQSSRIIVTGFVDDVMPYFASAMCMVAPLFLGAGVKVKIIEALSAGVPVLTNHIGSEGIAIKDKRDYFHCTTPKEYETIIRGMLSGKIDVEKVASNAQTIISEKFDLEKSFKGYSKRIYSLLR